jgi:hypothetical protein
MTVECNIRQQMLLSSLIFRYLKDSFDRQDLWLYAPPNQIPKMRQFLEQSISATGRKINEVRRNYNLAGTIFEGGANKEGQRQEDMIMVTNSEQDGLLVYSMDFWIDTIVIFYKDLQMDSFIFWPANESSEQVELFAKKVVPRVKKRI